MRTACLSGVKMDPLPEIPDTASREAAKESHDRVARPKRLRHGTEVACVAGLRNDAAWPRIRMGPEVDGPATTWIERPADICHHLIMAAARTRSARLSAGTVDLLDDFDVAVPSLDNAMALFGKDVQSPELADHDLSAKALRHRGRHRPKSHHAD